MTPERVQSAHRAWVMEQLETAGTYLLLEDPSDLDWTGRAPIPGLGPIGHRNESTQGVRLHSVIAARAGMLTRRRTKRAIVRVWSCWVWRISNTIGNYRDRLGRRMTIPSPASAGNGNHCAGCARVQRWVRHHRACVGYGR